MKGFTLPLMTKKSRRTSKKGETRSRGSVLRSLDPLDAFEQQKRAFEKKFGRPPGPDDPIFFDPAEDKPVPMPLEKIQKQMLAAMQKSGMPPQFIFAYRKTGRLLTASKLDEYPPEIVAEWKAAVAEYFSLEAKREHSDAAPDTAKEATIPLSEIPELQVMEFSEEEQQLVLDCVHAIDIVVVVPTSVRMKVELAAALLVHACSAAYDSAGAQGRPEQAQSNWEAFEALALLRARELFALRNR